MPGTQHSEDNRPHCHAAARKQEHGGRRLPDQHRKGLHPFTRSFSRTGTAAEFRFEDNDVVEGAHRFPEQHQRGLTPLFAPSSAVPYLLGDPLQDRFQLLPASAEHIAPLTLTATLTIKSSP